MSDAHGRPTVAEVSLGALRANCRQAIACVGPRVRVLAVVKADAYGHGAVAAGRAFLEAGAWGLGVSSVAEGVELRRAGIDAPVVVLFGAFPGEEPVAVGRDLAVTVSSVDQARALAAAGAACGRPARVHLKVNTGITLLGIEPDDVAAFVVAVRDLAGLRIDGIFSHFASADDVDGAVADAQLARFRAAVEALVAAGVRPEHVHLANSAAVLSKPDAHFTMVRPGLMLYGLAPSPHLRKEAALVPAMRFRTAVALVRDAAPGARVGYGGEFLVQRPSRIAVLPLGYADGYHRLNWTHGAAMLVRGHRVPVAGRVCMDHTMLDVTDVPGVVAGDPVVVFGTQGGETVGADEVARWSDTIGYEVLTSVGRRVPRIHVEAFDV